MKGLLDYLEGDSVLHKLHPLTKITASILICAAAFCSSNIFFLLGIIVLNLLLLGYFLFHTVCYLDVMKVSVIINGSG